MMTKNQVNERKQMGILAIEQLVPQDHLVRKLDATIDFSFIYPSFEQIFYQVLKEVADRSLLGTDYVFIDSAHVKTSANKRKLEKKTVRKEMVERVFADAKEKHGMQSTGLRGLEKLSM